MSMINVVLRSYKHECKAKVEELPTLFIAQKNNFPVKFFWTDMVVVMNESDLKKFQVPNSNFMQPIVLQHGSEQWRIGESVIYSKSVSPIGNLIVVVIRPESYEYLGATERNAG